MALGTLDAPLWENIRTSRVPPAYRGAVDRSIPLPPGVRYVASTAQIERYRGNKNDLVWRTIVAVMWTGLAITMVVTNSPVLSIRVAWIAIAAAHWALFAYDVRRFRRRQAGTLDDLPPFGLTIWPERLMLHLTADWVNVVPRRAITRFTVDAVDADHSWFAATVEDVRGHPAPLAMAPLDLPADELRDLLIEWYDRRG